MGRGRWYTAISGPLLAAPVVIYLWKMIVWDIVLRLGTSTGAKTAPGRARIADASAVEEPAGANWHGSARSG